ncbi:predicted protein [Sclerotinia sclerotiorum 1980 UF-70]|uniref:Uncharacterized protein n=1 Tax=Sclerotinia sclerotiorum (strain ATCC 18683 / 1980 / Ss-1) TaxID=665079 RepID=A7ECE2_SCLS1|nr:predicted protein [Sclerotinia sclerotiorum 1980 UF-70]EDO00121.1 predicted protein [Sclerotinia sclerotiorum 1980 UF-70]
MVCRSIENALEGVLKSYSLKGWTSGVQEPGTNFKRLIIAVFGGVCLGEEGCCSEDGKRDWLFELMADCESKGGESKGGESDGDGCLIIRERYKRL